MSTTFLTVALVLSAAAEPGQLCFADADCPEGSRCSADEAGRNRCDAPSPTERAERIREERADAALKEQRARRHTQRADEAEGASWSTLVLVGSTCAGGCGGGLLGALGGALVGQLLSTGGGNIAPLFTAPPIGFGLGAAAGAVGGCWTGGWLVDEDAESRPSADVQITQLQPVSTMAF